MANKPGKATAFLSIIIGSLISIASAVVCGIAMTHYNDECNRSNLALSMLLALIGVGIRIVYMVADYFPEVIHNAYASEDDQRKTPTAIRILRFLIGVYSLGITIFVCVEVAHSSTSTCSRTLYAMSLAYVIIEFSLIAFAVLVFVLSLCIMCCACATLGVIATEEVVKGSIERMG